MAETKPGDPVTVGQPLAVDLNGRSHLTLPRGFLLLLAVSLLFRLALVPIRMNRRDRQDYIGSAQKVARFGLINFYEPSDGDRPAKHAPVPYPPIPVYFYAIAGYIYEKCDPSFATIPMWRRVPVDSLALNYLIEIPVILFELLLTTAIFLFLRARFEGHTAIVCAAMYVLNPAVLFDGAIWAQPDAIHSFFLSVAVIFLVNRKPLLSMPAMALALLSKPQPIALVPLFALVTIRAFPAPLLWRASQAALASALFVLLPFLLCRPSELGTIAKTISTSQQYVSLNAHNLWWVVAVAKGLDPRWLSDGSALSGRVSYLAASTIVLCCMYAVIAAKALRSTSPGLAPEPFAYVALMFFLFAVRMHENH